MEETPGAEGGWKLCKNGRLSSKTALAEGGRRLGWAGTLPLSLCSPSPAILGMYTLMSNKQYYDAICSGEICNTEGISSEY